MKHIITFIFLVATLVNLLGGVGEKAIPCTQDDQCSVDSVKDPLIRVDLFSDASLARYKRVPWKAGEKLSEKNPWTLDAETKTLRADCAGIHEVLMYQMPAYNATLTLQFRFLPTPGVEEKGNSGIMVRTDAQNLPWLQAQLSVKDVGMLFGEFSGKDGKLEKFKAGQANPALFKPIGEWNDIEISMYCDKVALHINGQLVAVTRWGIRYGHIGFEAEYWPVEFRNAVLVRKAACM